MRGINIITKLVPKPFPLAQVGGNFILPSLPDGTANRASHHAQRREAGPIPTNLLSIHREANFQGGAHQKMYGPMSRGPSGGIVKESKDAILVIQPVDQIPSELSKGPPDIKAGRSPGAIQKTQQCWSISYVELLRQNRTGQRSSEGTECADRDGGTLTTMEHTGRYLEHTIPSTSRNPMGRAPTEVAI